MTPIQKKRNLDASNPSYPKRGEILHINLPQLKQSTGTLEPPRTTDSSIINIAYCLYEGLMRPTEDGSAIQGQAKTIEIDATKRIYRFHLKTNHWCDGTLVQAQHFENTWKQILTGKIDCPNIYLFDYFKNAKAIREKRLPIDEVGIRSLADDLLEVELESPFNAFLDLLATYLFVPLHPMSIEGFLPDPNSTSYPLISNGPFKLTHWIPNVELIFEKNEHFHRVDEISLKRIHFNYIGSEISAIDRFINHSMDILGRPFPPSLVKHKAMRYLFQEGHFQTQMLASTTCAILNLNRSPLNHPKLRRALSLAIDRTALARRLMMNEDCAATHLLPPVFNPETTHSQLSNKRELLEARRIFKEVIQEENIKPEDLFENLIIQYPHSELYFNLAMDLKEAWECIFDIKIRTQQFTLYELRTKLAQRTFSIVLLTWYPDYFHPLALLNRLRSSSNSKNYTGWSDPHFSRLLEKAENASTKEEGFQLCIEAEKILLDAMPVIPLMHGRYAAMIQTYIKNFHISPQGIINFDKVYLDENYEIEQNPLYSKRDKIVSLLQECIKPPFEYPIPVTDLLVR